MQTLKLDHKNYNKFSTVRQLVLPLDYSQMIPETESVRLLDAVLEELDYTALLRLYSIPAVAQYRIPINRKRIPPFPHCCCGDCCWR